MQVVVFVTFQHHCFILRFFVGAGIFFSPESPKQNWTRVSSKKSPLETRGSHSRLAFSVARTLSTRTHFFAPSLTHSLSLCYTPALSLLCRTLSRIFRTLLRARHQQVVERFPVHVFPTEKMTENATDRANVEPKSMRRRSIRCPVPRNRYQDRDKSANISFSVFFLCSCPHATKIHFLLGSSCSLSSLSLSRSLSSSLTHAQSPSLFLAHSVD